MNTSTPKEAPADAQLVITLAKERNAPSVANQPDVNFLAWRIIEDALGEHRALGLMGPHTIRMTSPLQSIDTVTRTIVTESGRRYHLHQEPATESGIVAAMFLHALTQRVAVTRDVSDDIWTEMLGNTQ